MIGKHISKPGDVEIRIDRRVILGHIRVDPGNRRATCTCRYVVPQCAAGQATGPAIGKATGRGLF